MKKIISLLLVFILIVSVSTLSFAQYSRPSEWAQESVDKLKMTFDFKGSIFADYSGNISRGEFIYLAVKAYELLNYNDIEIDPSINFSDTNDKYVIKAASLGITQGVGQGKFGYNDALTRAQLATLMTNTIKLMGHDLEDIDGDQFTDEESFSSWAKESIYFVKKNGILNGIENEEFDAQGYATKEEAFVIIYNTLRKYGYGQFTFSDTSGYEMSADSIMPNIESIKEKYKGHLTFNFGQDSLSISFKESADNISSFSENFLSGSIDIFNYITVDSIANQARDEVYSELLGKDEYTYINDAISDSKKCSEYSLYNSIWEV